MVLVKTRVFDTVVFQLLRAADRSHSEFQLLDGSLRAVTRLSDFPTQNAFQNVFGGGFDAFVAKFNTAASGAASLELCSYLGGSGDDKAFGIRTDNGATTGIYLVGQTSSSNFPVLNAAQPVSGGNFDAFVAKVNGDGAKVYATYLGGSGDDRGTVALGGAGVVQVPASSNFPTLIPFKRPAARRRWFVRN